MTPLPPPSPSAQPHASTEASLFGHLLAYAMQHLSLEGFARTPLPAEWAERHALSPTPGGGPVLRSYSGAHPQRGTRWCAAHITGPRAEILNLMIYPRNAARVPVFAVEYIAFTGKPRVAVVDLQPAAGSAQVPGAPGADLTSQVIAALGDTTRAPAIRAALPTGGELPDWAVPHFTPACIYSRPTSPNAAEMPLLTEAFHLYFNTWRTEFLPHDDGREATAQELASAHLAAYQQHHAHHTPGRPFLRKAFGEAWTERYLREFMYHAE